MTQESMFDEMSEVLDVAVSEVEERYQAGCIQHTRECHDELYREIKAVEASLTEIWYGDLDGAARVERFKEALRKWWGLFMESIRLFKLENMQESS